MSWAVSTIVSGGRYTAADEDRYDSTARVLYHHADVLQGDGSLWQQCAWRMLSAQQRIRWCAAAKTTNDGGFAPPTDGSHVPSAYANLHERCTDHARQCQHLGKQLNELADLLMHARSMYSQAETATRTLLNTIVQHVAGFAPLATAAGTAVLVGAGMAHGAITHGKSTVGDALTSTAWAQEGLLNALATPVAWWSGRKRSSSAVADAAGAISAISAGVNNHMQGNTLRVEQVHAGADVVRASASVTDALRNLRRLADEHLFDTPLQSGLDYGTIAIQSYRHADGSRSWLVVVPGTDGQPDSPFGWEQNLELMSSDQRQRREADSARMVAQAMERAGIGRNEPVGIIGHSQGGIVAATIASDWSNRFNIHHIVTAGSPIANHPIPSRTWVTSVEMDNELVAALDGKPNPVTDHWLTIRGSVHELASPATPPPPAISAPKAFRFTPVHTSSHTTEISHWLHYHQAAYRNAADMGLPSVQRHERHFRTIVDGTLESTTYWKGRMERGHDGGKPSQSAIERTDSPATPQPKPDA